MKNTTTKNFKLIIEPEEDNLQGIKNVLFQIQKHCDGFSDFHIEHETYCNHCNLLWEQDWIDGHKPYCCQEAMNEWQKEEDESNLKEIEGR